MDFGISEFFLFFPKLIPKASPSGMSNFPGITVRSMAHPCIRPWYRILSKMTQNPLLDDTGSCIIQEEPMSSLRGSWVISKYSFVISKRILCHLQEHPVSFLRGSWVISKRNPCHLQEEPVSSPRESFFISKSILCHLQKDHLSSPRGFCVIFKRIRCHF